MNKILYILSSTSPFGGSTKSIGAIIERIASDPEFECGIVLPQTNGVYQGWRKKGYNVYCVDMRHANKPSRQTLIDVLLYPLRFIFHKYINFKAKNKIKEIVNRDQYNIIHTNVGVLDVGCKVAEELHIPHVWHIREYQDLDFGEHFYPSKTAFIARLKSVNNYTIAITRDLSNYFQCDLSKSAVVYNGVLDSQIPSIIWDKQQYLLFVGRISEGKGVDEVIKAFAEIHKSYPNYKLKIAGAPVSIEYGRHMKDLVNCLGLEDIVEFLGVIDDCTDLMQTATCLIMSSKSEGLGRVTIEAMSNGCLVVGKNTMGTKEQFDNGLSLTGGEIGIRYNTIDELISILDKICNKGIESYKPMIEAAQLVVFKLYSVSKCYNSIKSIYNKIR